MEKSCLHCHFFCKQSSASRKDMSSPIISLSEKEREHLDSNPSAIDNYGTNIPTNSLLCYMGNWSKNPGSLFSLMDKTTLSRDRENCCYFMPHRPDMVLLAGAQSKEGRQWKKSSKFRFVVLMAVGGSIMIYLLIVFLK